MEVPTPVLPQTTSASQPGAALPTSAAPGSDAGIPSESFAQIFAAGLTEPGTPSVLDPLADASAAVPGRGKTTPDTSPEDPQAVALMLAALGLPVAIPATPAVPSDMAASATAETPLLSRADLPSPRSSTIAAGTDRPAARATPRASTDDGAPHAIAAEPVLGANANELAPHANPDESASRVAPSLANVMEATPHDTPATQAPEQIPAAQAVPPLQAAHATPSVHASNAVGEIKTPIHVSGWDADLGNTLIWMAKGDGGSAQIRLNPPDLGPLQINLTLGTGDSGQANVVFASPHGAVREAIEAAIPHLRDMLAGSGIALGQATVNAESFQQPGNPGGTERDPGSDPGRLGLVESTTTASTVRTGVGLVDTFA